MRFKRGQPVYLYQNHELYKNNYRITTFNGIFIKERGMFSNVQLDNGSVYSVFTEDIKLKDGQLLFDFMWE